jgi:hypothetical protein
VIRQRLRQNTVASVQNVVDLIVTTYYNIIAQQKRPAQLCLLVSGLRLYAQQLFGFPADVLTKRDEVLDAGIIVIPKVHDTIALASNLTITL